MSGRAADGWDSAEAWSEARARARADVQSAFAPQRRVCASCGHEETTAARACSRCGTPYVALRDPGMSRAAKRRLTVGALGVIVLIALGAAILVPGIQHTKSQATARQQRATRAALAAERRRIAAEQRLHAAAAPGSHSALRALPAARLAGVLRGDLEGSITADARARVGRHALQGPIERTDCAPVRGFAGPPLGKYTCTAVTQEVIRGVGGAAVGTIGYPFWAVIDFKRLSYVWCKVNPKAGEGSATSGAAALAVPLPRQCDLGL
jgi:type II secretory pathway pseudopilin PulG